MPLAPKLACRSGRAAGLASSREVMNGAATAAVPRVFRNDRRECWRADFMFKTYQGSD